MRSALLKAQNRLEISCGEYKKSFELEENLITENNFVVKMSPIREFLLIKPNFSEVIIQTDSIDAFNNLIYLPDFESDQSFETIDPETVGILNLESLSYFLIFSLCSCCCSKLAK